MTVLTRYAAMLAAACLAVASPALAQDPPAEGAVPVDKKAEAAAKKAEADARKKEAAEKKKAEAEQKKAEAEAKKADAAAKKAEADAKKKAEADAKKAADAASKAEADAAKKAEAEKKKLEADAKKADAAAKKAEADARKKEDADKKKAEADAKKMEAEAKKADAARSKEEEAAKKKAEADAKKAEAETKKAEARRLKEEEAARKKAEAEAKKAEAEAKKAEAKRLKEEEKAKKKAAAELKKQEAEAKRLGKPWPPVPEQSEQPALAAEPDFSEPISPVKPAGGGEVKTPASASMDAPNQGERPWAKGVSKEKQAEAIALFREGNANLRDSLWSKAVEKYNAALKIWDHPGIHYNLALALVNLDRPIETHDHLQAALKYGAMPLDSDKHDQALRYMVLVEKQLTRIDVRCDLPGASVKLDGREIFVGPGRYEGLVTAGKHSIIATKEGYLPREINETFPPGDTRIVDVQLQTEADMMEMRRLFSNAIPWTVLLGGVAVAGGSLGLHFAANGSYQAYDRGINDCSNADPVVGGCTPSLDLQSKKATGDTLQSLAFVGYGVGGAAVLTGAILLYVNRLQPYRRQTVDVVNTKPEVTVAPLLGPGVGGAQLNVSF